MESLHFHRHCNVVEILCAYVKVTWYAIELKIALKTTALLLLKLLLSACSEILSRHIFLAP